LSQRWAIWLTVEGDLRFCSHRDMMRALERAALRAELPLRYTQGFNPHPIHSLALPRAVGVTSRDDLWVLTLDEDRTPDAILAALESGALPRGLSVVGAREIPAKISPQPVVSDYELAVPLDVADEVAACVGELQTQDAWPIERKKKPKGRGRQAPQFKTVDLKTSVPRLALDGDTLHLTIRSTIIPSARPNEMIKLLGMEPAALSHLTRTGVVYSITPDNETDFRKEAIT
jgi:radical SAM-linked protein